MKRLLFVDDEQQVLDGLRDLLRKQRKEWDMVFALGGEVALCELEQSSFDVVISDMRMPGMNGAQLLQRVKEQQPRAARIILSGHAERESVVNALPVAHQFLSKPCDPELLRTVIDRACGLQALLQEESVRDVIGRVEKLPSTPRIYFELTQAARDPDVSLADMAAIVQQDTSMAVKVLQLVNSSYFGLTQTQTSVQRAVTYLGSELLRALALTAHVFSPTGSPVVKGFSLEALQQHALLAARIAKRFLRDSSRANDAFTAALVHDVGEIVLALSVPERYEEVLRKCTESGLSTVEVEKSLLGVTHAEVGAYLLGLWGLPLEVVEAVAYHHAPRLIGANPTETVLAVHVASALSERAPSAPIGERCDGREPLDVECVEASPFGRELPRWRAEALAEVALSRSAAP